jgi:hypothetical protein
LICNYKYPMRQSHRSNSQLRIFIICKKKSRNIHFDWFTALVYVHLKNISLIWICHLTAINMIKGLQNLCLCSALRALNEQQGSLPIATLAVTLGFSFTGLIWRSWAPHLVASRHAMGYLGPILTWIPMGFAIHKRNNSL